MCVCVCVCVCACACARARVRACVRACVCGRGTTKPATPRGTTKALFNVLNDGTIIQTIATSISEIMVKKQIFLDILVTSVIESDNFAAIKDELYKACCVDMTHSNVAIMAVEARVGTDLNNMVVRSPWTYGNSW